MRFSSYVVISFPASLLVIVVICMRKAESQSLYDGDPTNNVISETSIKETNVNPLSIEKFNNALAIDILDENENRRNGIHKKKTKRKHVSDENGELGFPIHKYLQENMDGTTPSVIRARGYYKFPTGKHRSKTKYVNFRPLDLQLRDNLSASSESNESNLGKKHGKQKRPKFHQTTQKPTKDSEKYRPSRKIKPSPALIRPTGTYMFSKKRPKLDKDVQAGDFLPKPSKASRPPREKGPRRPKTPKVVYPTKYPAYELVSHHDKHKHKRPKLVYPSGKYPVDGIVLPTNTFATKRKPKLVYPTISYASTINAMYTDRRSSKNGHVTSVRTIPAMYVDDRPSKQFGPKISTRTIPAMFTDKGPNHKTSAHTIAAIYTDRNSKKTHRRPKLIGDSESGVESSDHGAKTHYSGEPSDEAATIRGKISTRCSTVEPLPKLDSKYIPNETREGVPANNDDAEFYTYKINNYLPPHSAATPRLYIDDA